MDQKKKLAVLVLIIVLLFGGAYLLYGKLGTQSAPEFQEAAEQGEAETEEKTPAPAFTVYDIDGNAVSLSDFEGKPVVLNFWASWCGFCKQEMPDFQKVWEEKGGDVQFMMVNVTDNGRETVEAASGFIAEQGYTFPVFYDTEFEASSAYSAYQLPVTYFIDAEGNIAARGMGALDEASLRQGIEMITAE